MAETTQTPIKIDLASPKLHHGGDEIQKFGTIRRMPLGCATRRGPRAVSS